MEVEQPLDSLVNEKWKKEKELEVFLQLCAHHFNKGDKVRPVFNPKNLFIHPEKCKWCYKFWLWMVTVCIYLP